MSIRFSSFALATTISIGLPTLVPIYALSATNHGTRMPATHVAQKCELIFSTPNTKQESLSAMGYDPTVAERIAQQRPDIAETILLNLHVPRYLRPSTQTLVSRRQSKAPVLVYRGLIVDPTQYNPKLREFQYMDDVVDTMFVAPDSLWHAERWATPRKPGPRYGLIVEMQFPRYMLEFWPKKLMTATADMKSVEDCDTFTTRIAVIDFSKIPLDQRGRKWGEVNHPMTWYTLEEFKAAFRTGP